MRLIVEKGDFCRTFEDFAPRPSQSLWAPFRGAKSSQQFRAASGGRLQSAALPAARFAPRSPQSLVVPSRGAKSSQRFRAAACLRRPFPQRDLLPAPRKALRFRPGEQNLHRNSAPLPISTIPRCKELTTKALSSIFRRQF